MDRSSRIAAILLIIVAALPQGHELVQDSRLQQLLADGEAQLADALQRIDLDFPEAGIAGQSPEVREPSSSRAPSTSSGPSLEATGAPA